MMNSIHVFKFYRELLLWCFPTFVAIQYSFHSTKISLADHCNFFFGGAPSDVLCVPLTQLVFIWLAKSIGTLRCRVIVKGSFFTHWGKLCCNNEIISGSLLHRNLAATGTTRTLVLSKLGRFKSVQSKCYAPQVNVTGSNMPLPNVKWQFGIFAIVIVVSSMFELHCVFGY